MYSKYTGIILKKYPLGEADELLTIYTKETGKLRAKAISSRKIQSRLAGHLSSLNEISFETATSARGAQGGRSSGIPVITSVRALSINNYLRENLRKFAYALVAVETLYRITADGQENQRVYEALSNFLKNLGESPDENLEVRKFQLALLAASGYEMPGDNTSKPPLKLRLRSRQACARWSKARVTRR
jgi:DNA repair protein RecO (recombination protein O)